MDDNRGSERTGSGIISVKLGHLMITVHSSNFLVGDCSLDCRIHTCCSVLGMVFLVINVTWFLNPTVIHQLNPLRSDLIHSVPFRSIK